MVKKAVETNEVPWLIPYLTVRNVDDAARFYEKAFRFKVKDLSPGDDGSTWHAELIYKNQWVMLGKEGAWKSTTKSPASSGVESPMNLYLYTEEVDEFYKQAITHQAISLSTPEDMFWGDRMCRLKDPDGYVWCFATRLKI